MTRLVLCLLLFSGSAFGQLQIRMQLRSCALVPEGSAKYCETTPGYASAFGFKERGGFTYLMTARHNLLSATKVECTADGRKWLPVTVVTVHPDKNLDVAIVKAPGRFRTYVLSGDRPSLGEAISLHGWRSGWPGPRNYATGRAVLPALPSGAPPGSFTQPDPYLFEVDRDTLPGNSGGFAYSPSRRKVMGIVIQSVRQGPRRTQVLRCSRVIPWMQSVMVEKPVRRFEPVRQVGYGSPQVRYESRVECQDCDRVFSQVYRSQADCVEGWKTWIRSEINKSQESRDLQTRTVLAELTRQMNQLRSDLAKVPKSSPDLRPLVDRVNQLASQLDQLGSKTLTEVERIDGEIARLPRSVPDVSGLEERLGELEERGRRVLWVNGQTGTVMDDETFGPREPIVLEYPPRVKP